MNPRGKILFSVAALLLLGPLRKGALLESSSNSEAAEPSVSQETADLDTLHARNIARLHTLYHQLRGAVKEKETEEMTEQLSAMKEALRVVEETERNHPQWKIRWAERHATLLALSREMEALVLDLNKGHDGAILARMENNLKEMKQILDVW